MDEFKRNEVANVEVPLNPGHFKPFLESISKLQKSFEGEKKITIRTALVTARNAPSHKRAIKTLRTWGISIDEMFFLGGLPKAPVLQKLRPHIFFDDQMSYCKNASKVVPTCHVPYGVANK